MRRIAVAASVVVVMLVVTSRSARALDCHGRLVVIGASPWDVKERCGEPSAIDDVMIHVPQRAYDPISQTTVYTSCRCSRVFGPTILARRASYII